MNAVLQAPAAEAHSFAAPAPVPTFAAGLGSVQANADAELIRLCAAYITASDIYNADCSGLNYEVDPLWHALERLEAQLEDLTASTFEGLLAKARVAQHQARQPDGSENYKSSFTGDWPERIIRDLLAMAEGVGLTPGVDATLVAAHADDKTFCEVERSLDDSPEPAFGTPDAEARETFLVGVLQKQSDAIEAAITTPARSVVGLRAKAAMLAHALPPAVSAFELGPDSEEIRLALSLAADLCGGQV